MRTWLKDIRNQKELTQDEVAKLSGIKRAYYTMIEQGNRNPSVTVSKSIADALNFEWTYFFNNKCNDSKQLDTDKYDTEFAKEVI